MCATCPAHLILTDVTNSWQTVKIIKLYILQFCPSNTPLLPPVPWHHTPSVYDPSLIWSWDVPIGVNKSQVHISNQSHTTLVPSTYSGTHALVQTASLTWENLDWGGWKIWRGICRRGSLRDGDRRELRGKNGRLCWRGPRLSDGRRAKSR
jgi:hypothetical protein